MTASIKPGYQCRRSTCYMTLTGLPVLPAIPFRYENRSRRQQTPCQSLPHGMPAKLTRVRLRRHTGSKDLRCFLSRQRYVLICRSSIAGSARGYVALRRNMRTKLKGPEVVFLRALLYINSSNKQRHQSVSGEQIHENYPRYRRSSRSPFGEKHRERSTGQEIRHERHA